LKYKFLILSTFPALLFILGLYLMFMDIGLSYVLGRMFAIISTLGFAIAVVLSMIIKKNKWYVWLGLGIAGLVIVYLLGVLITQFIPLII